MAVASLVCPHCEKPVEVQVSGVTRSRTCPACGEVLMLQMAEKGQKKKRRALLMGATVPEVPTTSTINLSTRQEAPQEPATTPATPESGKSSAPITDSGTPPPPAPRSHGPAAFALKPELDSRVRESADDLGNENNDHAPTTGSLPRPMVLEPSVEPRVLGGDAFDRMRMDPEVKEFRRRFITGTSIVVVIVALLVTLHWLTGNRAPAQRQIESTSEPQTVREPEDSGPPPVPEGSLVFKPPGTSDFQRIEMSGTPSLISSNQISLDTSLSVEVLRKFLSAPTWKERIEWTRRTPGLEERMEAYYSTHADGEIPVDNIVESREAENGFFQHTVIFEGGGRRQAYVQKTPNGPRVDWASFVGAGDISWSEFLEKRPTTATLMRVLVTDGFFYENQFGSPRALKCLELRNVTEPGAPMIHGYLERSSDLAPKIEFWQKESVMTAVPLILRLKYPVDSRSERQVWVTDFVAHGWLLE